MWHRVFLGDGEIKDAAVIAGGRDPVLYDLSAIDEFRTDEAKVPANTFLIVDTTGATYGRVPEDDRKGQKREVIGIIPVVTTAANAMYAQSLITPEIYEVSAYESLAGSKLKTLVAYDPEDPSKLLEIDRNEMSAGGLLSSDVVKRINTTGYFTKNFTYEAQEATILSSFGNLYSSEDAAKDAWKVAENAGIDLDGYTIAPVAGEYCLSGKIRDLAGYRVEFKIVDLTAVESLTGDELEKFEILSSRSQSEEFIYECKNDAERVGLAIARDALQTPCFSFLSALLEPEVVDVYGDYNDKSLAFVTEAERDAKYDELAGSDLAVDLAKWSTEGTRVQDSSEEPEKYAIISADTHVVVKELDPTDPRYGWHGENFDDRVPETLALDANNYFSTIQPARDGGFEPDHLKDIGVVVYRAYLDPSEGNKVSYEPVEAFCGSLCKEDKDPNTGVTKFIDTIVNTNSQYINFFSNCFNDTASKKFYKDSCDILLAHPSVGSTLGFYSPMTKEEISINKSILDGMNKAFEKVSDINKLDIDIVCDAGISNIASYLKAIFGNKGPYDLAITDDLGNSMLGMWQCKKYDAPAVKIWKTVVQKLDNFCKNVRKDCMFITECPRPLVLQGQKKIIRESKPANTIDANILPYLPAVCGLNTNYGAGYLDWFEMADDYTGDFFWCPPSIKAMGVYINTDVNYWYWDAPAGLNRGVIQATDVAFSPTIKQAGSIYEKNWNYAINYPQDGIVLEGQKTFQVKPSAFDRVNARRLFLRLERAAYKVSRYFVYEGNTQYTRQRLVDALDPYFKEAKNNGGVYDYKIICDETINDPDTIDRNELKVKIGIKPVKTGEFIEIQFICARTGASWPEVL